jgi:hypothetical protein
MGFHRADDGTGPARPEPVAGLTRAGEIRFAARSSRLGSGTLACPECDAPVALGASRRTPAEPLGCPFCGHAGAVRDFLSLGAPSRPARVTVRVLGVTPA